ncbi:pyrroloquinoline quinone biosynthesis protein PqqB [Cohnella endophytica]|uniref:Coenzyme PQQ synthesis protein B n=1 Tax=Cohnella endophytica TaxID=2419778 RepID=A0A494XE24_9BACL|nr:pyrroloquinoline quinone biosynthesis protein PqqB [Cohnella endophytica]RKP47921.1 pyrroloquinoline quinone biosynthesis protein PqqB [Cohnella endophytica]
MLLKVLGSSAGGGFPQWNCACPICRRARQGTSFVHARMTDSLALSADGKTWYLINATPEVCAQIESCSELIPGPKVRDTPISGVLLTDAELDHAIGLLSLRQGADLEVYATAPVLDALTTSFPVRKILEPYAAFRWSEVKPEESFPLFGGRLWISPIFLGNKPPRYASRNQDAGGAEPWVVGYRIVDRVTGGVVVYAPGIELWTEALQNQLEQADCVFIDGTFWFSDELRRLGVSDLVAEDMGHVPITGPNGSLERLANLSAHRKVYIHINNTNPILDERSIEYLLLKEQGIEVGYDGLELEV